MSIFLIPKVDKPGELGQFRPINLCNVVYKIASKTVANRLRSILPEVVSKEQSAFVLGRLIIENIITASRTRENRFCALKLDMKQAYDRMEWDYLQKIMLKLDFHMLWVGMIMRMINSVSFSVMFNDQNLDSFKPSRGIHQGDPISP